MDKIHIDIIIIGSIQNIGFAFQSMRIAERLNICGFSKYIGVDTMKIEAEGNQVNLDEFVSWCKTGLPEAGKLDVQIKSSIYVGYDNFIITDFKKK